MPEEISKNIEWLFSGAGVVIGLAILNYIRKIKFSAPAKFINFTSEYITSLLKSSEDISKNINIDMRPRHVPIELWVHELPKNQAWLRIINLNPFALTIKNISIEFVYGGMPGKSRSDYHDITIGKYSIYEDILVEGNLTSEQADYIVQYKDNPQFRAIIRATFKSPSKGITYESGWLEGVHTRLVNDQYRKAKLSEEKE